MTDSFYRVLANPKDEKRWFLDEPLTKAGHLVDARIFTLGTCYNGPTPVIVPIGHPGDVVNFNFAAFDMPVVSDFIAQIIQQHAAEDVQCFPVTLGKRKVGFQILNAIARIKCLDESLSEVTKWQEEDNRPDKIGSYRMVTSLRVSPPACINKQLFRVQGWEIALIVSKSIKEAIEQTNNSGVIFDSVCP